MRCMAEQGLRIRPGHEQPCQGVRQMGHACSSLILVLKPAHTDLQVGPLDLPTVEVATMQFHTGLRHP